MSLNQQRQQQSQQQKLESQRSLALFTNAVNELQNEIKVYYGMLERNEEISSDKYKSTSFKFLKFEKEMSNQIEEIQQKFFQRKSFKNQLQKITKMHLLSKNQSKVFILKICLNMLKLDYVHIRLSLLQKLSQNTLKLIFNIYLNIQVIQVGHWIIFIYEKIKRVLLKFKKRRIRFSQRNIFAYQSVQQLFLNIKLILEHKNLFHILLYEMSAAGKSRILQILVILRWFNNDHYKKEIYLHSFQFIVSQIKSKKPIIFEGILNFINQSLICRMQIYKIESQFTWIILDNKNQCSKII
ncbi:unnamed protein product [Paramecium sonneborni]|uniref:Uncharacterized protein n=1 Tax=Paramecium sonneborni TaxID=65129 RepID=A0A8S1L923_9CILI|nr:unnamed protein product [Paramecium sonneborni]